MLFQPRFDAYVSQSKQILPRQAVYKYTVIFHHGLPTLAVPYNKIFLILLALYFKEPQIICKLSYMKCFKTIFSNSYFLPTTIDVSLGTRLDLMFTCRKSILFYVEYSNLPFSSYVKSFINYYIPSYMPQCLLVPDLAQLLATRLLSILLCPQQTR